MDSPRRRVWSLLLVATTIVTGGATTAARADSPSGAAPLVDLAADLLDDPACGGLLRLGGTELCAHGPDGPEAHDAYVAAGGPGPAAAAPRPVTCDDGASGPRVQAVYVVPTGSPNRVAELGPRIREWAAAIDRIVADSSGGHRSVRWALDAGCRISVARLQVSGEATSSFGRTIDDLVRAGFNRPDRRYLLWFDAEAYCGIATLWADDRPDAANRNNAGAAAYGRVDRRCWGGGTEAHELLHMLGAAQASAPNATAGGHCTDDADLLCYADARDVRMRQVCPSAAERLLDCNRDDYFNVSPPPGSYLATHWNVARSSFLHGSPPSPATVDHRFEGRLSSSARTERRPFDAGAGAISVRVEHATGPSEDAATNAGAVAGGAITTANRGGSVVTSAPATWAVRVLDARGVVVAAASGTGGTVELRLPGAAVGGYQLEVASDGSGDWRGVVTTTRHP
jgi:hypothetical protein